MEANYTEDGGGLVAPHREQHENGYDAVRLLKIAQRTPGDAGSVLYSDGSDPVQVAWSASPRLAGSLRVGDTDAPANVAAGDVTIAGILSVGVDAAPAANVTIQVAGAGAFGKWTRTGSLTALTGATTDGDHTVKRLFVEDANFIASIVSSNPRITFAANDYLEYGRSTDILNLTIGSTPVMRADATSLRHVGYMSLIADLTTAPANTTAGDMTAKRGHFGTDGAFTSGYVLEVTGKAKVSSELLIGGDLNHDGTSIGFFTVAPATRQTVNALTNNVTSGGSADTIANFTDLVTYANDAAAIRGDLYRLAVAYNSLRAALLQYGLVQ